MSISMFLAAAALARPQTAASAPTEWLRRNAVRLATAEAGHGFEDLQPLKAMIGGARVVGLGEGTHGTREYFQMKHRLLEFLATELNFSIFSIEASMPEAYALDAYVLGGEGDVDRLIGGMYFWTWNTEEVRDMVEWMRRFNAEQAAKGAKKRVHFTGFDMQTGKVALENARAFVEANDAQFAVSSRADFERLAAFDPRAAGSASSFGCATGKFPVDVARGKKVRFTGFVKTEGVDDWAGLWWRVDGPTPRFDNMRDRGARKTTDWSELELEMDVPADAQAIFFGLVMPGNGRAWFDALAIEVDGAPWSDARFDLDFERDQPEGIVAADPSGGRPSGGYECARDESAVKTGRSSLRIERTPSGAGDAAAAQTAARGILDHMVAARARYAEKRPARDVDWAIQNARVVVQWSKLAATDDGFAHRDRSMAENLLWIAERDPEARIVVWAHNWHVRDEEPFMGRHLREELGERYVNVAFCASRGTYYALGARGNKERVHELAEPPEGSFEAILATADAPILLVDLRTAKDGDAGSGWLTETRRFGGIIGALEAPDHYQSTKLAGHFDLLIYLRDTSAARQLATAPRTK